MLDYFHPIARCKKTSQNSAVWTSTWIFAVWPTTSTAGVYFVRYATVWSDLHVSFWGNHRPNLMGHAFFTISSQHLTSPAFVRRKSMQSSFSSLIFLYFCISVHQKPVDVEASKRFKAWTLRPCDRSFEDLSNACLVCVCLLKLNSFWAFWRFPAFIPIPPKSIVLADFQRLISILTIHNVDGFIADIMCVVHASGKWTGWLWVGCGNRSCIVQMKNGRHNRKKSCRERNKQTEVKKYDPQHVFNRTTIQKHSMDFRNERTELDLDKSQKIEPFKTRYLLTYTI